jgi:hypothetical protein
MAKKKRKGKQAPQARTGAEKQQVRQERLEARRLAKAEAARRAAAAERRRRLVRLTTYLSLAALLVWFVFFRTQRPDEIGGHELIHASETGIGEHTTGTVTYETTPPVSGAHAPSPAPCGVHDRPIRNELMVHTLEHGAVGVLYDPSAVDEATVRAIEDIVRGYDGRTFSAPYEGMPSAIAVVSWGELMRLDELDEDAVREYIDTFRGKGPEGVPCDNEVDRPFELPEPTPAASPSPEATPSP